MGLLQEGSAIVELLLKRDAFDDKCTQGKLYIDGLYQCECLEPVMRPPDAPKVDGQTAIPLGRYPVTIERSPRLSLLMGHDYFTPRLHDIPGFEGVLIHPGNFPVDTHGCILPGLSRGPDDVLESVKAFEALFAKLKAAQGPIFITVAVVDLVKGTP